MSTLVARLLAAFVLCSGMPVAAMGESAAPGPQRASTFEWWPYRNPHRWQATFGNTRITVIRPEQTDDEDQEPLPWVQIATPGVPIVRFQADEWMGSYVNGILFRTDRLDPAHSTMDVLAAWYTGGAHCCTRVEVASLIGKQWKLINLQDWDLDPDAFPRPRIGPDGVPVLPLADWSFNYIFASHAYSGQPLEVLRVANGKVINVTAQPEYRPWLLKDMANWRNLCADPKETYHNGYCAAYAADAANAGQLDAAWPIVLQDSTDEKESFCGTWSAGRCVEMKFEHYADALRWFLKAHGYIKP